MLGWDEQAFASGAGPDPYSGSLDAVIRDVLPARSEWDVGWRSGYGYAWVRAAPGPDREPRADASHAAATPALALLAAALEARALLAEEPPS